MTGLTGRPVLSQRFVHAIDPSEIPEALKRRIVVILGNNDTARAWFRANGLVIADLAAELRPEEHVVVIWSAAHLTEKQGTGNDNGSVGSGRRWRSHFIRTARGAEPVDRSRPHHDPAAERVLLNLLVGAVAPGAPPADARFYCGGFGLHRYSGGFGWSDPATGADRTHQARSEEQRKTGIDHLEMPSSMGNMNPILERGFSRSLQLEGPIASTFWCLLRFSVFVRTASERVPAELPPVRYARATTAEGLGHRLNTCNLTTKNQKNNEGSHN